MPRSPKARDQAVSKEVSPCRHRVEAWLESTKCWLHVSRQGRTSRWRLEIAGQPAQRVRGHGVADGDHRFDAPALLALEASIIETGRPLLELGEQHAVAPAIRAPRPLDRANFR